MFASILFSWDTTEISANEVIKTNYIAEDFTVERNEFGNNLHCCYSINNDSIGVGSFHVTIEDGNDRDTFLMVKRILSVIARSVYGLWEELDDSVNKAFEDIQFIEDRDTTQFEKTYKSPENDFMVSIQIENNTKCVNGDIGSIGNIGIIQVGKGNKDELISFIMKRIENVVNENTIKNNNDYLELNMKYALQDIMMATRKYLGEDVDDKNRISNSTETN